MSEQESDLGRQMREASAVIASLRQTMGQFAACAEQIQGIMLFSGHPELRELDDELDTVYRGQI